MVYILCTRLSKEEAHQAFMKNYHKIFAKTQKSSLPPQTDDRF